MVMSNAANIAKFTRSAKRVLRQIETYATTGGEDCRGGMRIEIKLAAARDRLEDTMRPLEVEAEPACVALMAQVKQACRDCRDRAHTARQAGYAAEIARIDAEISAKRAGEELACPGITAYRAELRRSCR
jgi:hypothetical protein